MQHFIQQANQAGTLRQPFFFLIDFEQKKPIFSPPQSPMADLVFNFSGNNQKITKPFEFQITPPDFNHYQLKFQQVKQAIQAGNSYLLNLTERTEIQTNYSLEEIYQASQARYKCLLKNHFVCFSPEPFVRIQQNKIYAYPMKGTINAELDNAQTILMQSEKEFTEHNTIVDLLRNDLALVAQNICVNKYRYLEKIQTHKGSIYQTSSEISGELAENWQENIGTMLAKLLPAGSVSGAPKTKTCEIIAQAEKNDRGYYTGVFGYFDGESLESAVAIRYIEKQGEKYFFRSGGGITALSQLTDEYQELLEKVYVPISSF